MVLAGNDDMDIVPYAIAPRRPIPGESLFGYIEQVAVENEYPTPRSVMMDIGVKGHEGYMSEEGLRNLSLLTGVDQDTLAAMQSPYTDGFTTFAGHEIPTWYLNRTSAYVCPKCLQEGSHHKAIWAFRPIRFCLKHHVRLLTHCPAPDCGKNLVWAAKSFRNCLCGFEFSNATTEPANDNEIEYGHFMGELLALKPGEMIASTASSMPKEIVYWTIGKFLSLLGMILTFNLNHKLGREKNRFVRAGITIGDYPLAYEMLKAWPQIFGRYLPLKGNTRELVRQFDVELHQILLAENTDLSSYDAAMIVAFDAAVDMPKRLHSDMKLLLTVSEGAEATGLPATRFAALALQKGWRLSKVKGAGAQKPYDGRQVRAWAEKNKAISIGSAGKLLGATPRDICDLLDAGWLSVIDAPQARWHRTYVRYPELHKFERFLDNPDVADPGAPTISLTDINLRSNRALTSAFILICSVSGQIRPVGPRPARIANLVYRESDLARWLRMMSDYGSLPDAALTPFIRNLMSQYGQQTKLHSTGP